LYWPPRCCTGRRDEVLAAALLFWPPRQLYFGVKLPVKILQSQIRIQTNFIISKLRFLRFLLIFRTRKNLQKKVATFSFWQCKDDIKDVCFKGRNRGMRFIFKSTIDSKLKAPIHKNIQKLKGCSLCCFSLNGN
jgi:hypothetical protein